MKIRGKGKEGLSTVITTLLVILLALAAIVIISMIIINKINSTKEEIEALDVLGLENANIQKAQGDFENGGEINVTLQRTFSKAKKSTTIISRQSGIEKIPVDIVLVLDRSGSMRQSGWILNTSLTPSYTTTLTVPAGAYSPSYSFSVPPGTERLAVATTWDKIPGLDGSEGSELASNLRRPSGIWLVNNGGYPGDLGGKVDPPDSIGASNEYFSGISTKPQYYYIENPQSGTWQVKVYGWNLRPKTNPPATQDVSISVYMGDSASLNKSVTILSSELVKSASKDFVDKLDNQDRVAVVRFGSYAQVTQDLTSNKNDVKNAIDNIGSEGGTAIHTGIDEATQQLTEEGREDAMKIITILTDGQNDVGPNPVTTSAQQAKDLNYTIFTIGLTNFVDENLLRSIATKPEYYYYSDFNMLDEIYQELSNKIFEMREVKTIGVSLVMIFLNDESSCQKEIAGSELPELATIKTFHLNLEGCITNITRIELYGKINGKTGPLIDSIEVSP